MKKYSTEIKTKAVNLVTDSITNFENQRQTIRDNWVKYDKAYRAMYDKAKQAYNGDSQYTSPILQSNVETITARLAESVRIDEKAMDIKPNKRKPNYQINKQKAEIYKQIAETQAEQQDINNKKDVVIRMGAKYGTAIVKVPWIKKENEVKSNKVFQDPILDELGDPVLDQNGMPMFEEPRVEEVTEEVTEYMGPGYEVITDLEDIYTDMFIQRIQDQPIVIHRMLVDTSFIDEQVEKGNYFKDIAEKLKKSPDIKSSNSTTGTTRSEEVLGQSRMADVDGLIKEFEIFEAWAKFDVNDNGEEKEVIITIANDQLLGLRENPFWHQKKPFLAWKYMEIEGEFYGTGAIDPVINLWYDLNDTMNQMNDAAAFVLNPVIIEFIGNAKNKQNFKVAPGAVWAEKVQGAIRVLQQDMNTVMGAMSRLQDLERRINEGMGITPLINGSSDELDKTWRATKAVINQGDKKFKLRAKRFEQEMWQKWIELGFPMNAQLMDEPFLFVAGEDQQGNPIQLQIDVQDAIGEFTFNINGVEYFFDLQDRLEKTIQFSQLTANKPWINSMFLDRQLAEMMGLRDIDQIIVQPQPVEPSPSKPANVSIQLNPKDGTAIGMMAAQVLEQDGYNIDLNQAIDDAEIVKELTAPTNLLASGLLPDKLEEDIIESGAKPEDINKKVEVVTGQKPENKPEVKVTAETQE